MYEERFKKWGLRKYLKRSEKEDILHRVEPHSQARSPSSDPKVSSDNLRKALRYLKENGRTNVPLRQMKISMQQAGSQDISCVPGDDWDSHHTSGSTRSADHTPDSLASPSSSSSSWERIRTPPSDGHSSSSEDKKLAIDTEDQQTSLDSLAREQRWQSPSLFARMPAHFNYETLSMETVLRNVHLCCIRSTSDGESQSGTWEQIGAGPQAPFWGEFKDGIYFLKISCFEKAYPALRIAGDLKSSAFIESPLIFVREVFSTSSPVNTALCPNLRLSLLREFFTLAKRGWGATHPVKILCYELQKDGGFQEVSERALSFMANLLLSTQGILDGSTFRTQIALIRMLRRCNDYTKAAAMAQTLLSSHAN